MLAAVLAHLHNWFDDPRTRMRGRFAVVGGKLSVPDGKLLDGQFIRIVGSALNDGVYRWPTSGLADEEFTGEVWPLSVPKAVIELADEIGRWAEKHGDAARSPFASESDLGYSYAKQTRSDGLDGWQAAFKSDLDPYRKRVW